MAIVGPSLRSACLCAFGPLSMFPPRSAQPAVDRRPGNVNSGLARLHTSSALRQSRLSGERSRPFKKICRRLQIPVLNTLRRGARQSNNSPPYRPGFWVTCRRRSAGLIICHGHRMMHDRSTFMVPAAGARERFPLEWNRPIKRNKLKNNELEHVPVDETSDISDV